MADTNESVVKTINRGRLDIYIPLKFETEYDYNKLCKKIHECIDFKIKSYLDEFEDSFQNDLDEIGEKNHIRLYRNLTFKEKMKKWTCQKKSQKRDFNRENDGTQISLSNTNKGILVEFKPGEIRTFFERQEQLKEELEQHAKLYGSEYFKLHSRFVLLPLRVHLNNHKSVWLNVLLFVFGNKMGALKLELPLIDIDTQTFMDNDIDKMVETVEDRFSWLNLEEQSSVEAIYNAYIRKMVDALKLNIVTQGIFKNIICTEFNNMPKQVNNIPDNVQQDLFRIIAAPFQVRQGMSYKKIACDFIEKQSWCQSNVRYITSPTGGCLSIVDTAIVDWIKEVHKKELNIKELDDKSVENIHKILVRDLCINVEFAILILLLKKINVSYSYGMKIVRSKDIHRVQSAYNLNLMFIADLQMECYGSVSDQISAFEAMMSHYLKNEISTLKMDAIDRILLDEENFRYGLLQNFLAFGSIALTAVFGLPAIHETITYIRNALCIFVANDLPVVSIKNVSITLWVISIAYFVFYTINLTKNNSKKYLKF